MSDKYGYCNDYNSDSDSESKLKDKKHNKKHEKKHEKKHDKNDQTNEPNQIVNHTCSPKYIVNKPNTKLNNIGISNAMSDKNNKMEPKLVNQSYNYAYTPQQIRKAYGIDQLVPIDGDTQLGAGIKVGIIIAYHNPYIQLEMDTFCANFGIPTTTVNVVYANGVKPKINVEWGVEGDLDCMMIHAISPGATIYYVEAKSNYTSDLLSAVRYAVDILKVDVVNMSFGGSDMINTNTFINPNVSFIASSGDTGGVISFPSSHSNILSVGGTSLYFDNATGNYGKENVWKNAGCNQSLYYSKPAYQNGIAQLNSFNKRTTPDVSSVGDPRTGVFAYSVYYGYITLAGTSASSPILAGMIANANYYRKNLNKSMLTTVSGAPNDIHNYIYKTLYSNSIAYTSGCFNDITSGKINNQSATINYDIVSGIGSPTYKLIIALSNDLI